MVDENNALPNLVLSQSGFHIRGDIPKAASAEYPKLDFMFDIPKSQPQNKNFCEKTFMATERRHLRDSPVLMGVENIDFKNEPAKP